jgi:hypothetical protein
MCPAPVEPLTVEVPTFKIDKTGRSVMEIPDDVTEEIWHHRWLVHTGADDVDPLDGHLKLTQLKTAAALAVLHGNTRVTDEAWKIAGRLAVARTLTERGGA